MSIITIDNYQVNVRKPIDTRLVASNSVAREAISGTAGYIYDGLRCFQIDTKENWQWYSGTWSLENKGGVIGSTGSPNYVTKWGATAGTLDTSNIFSGTAGVGINTNDPKGALQINSTGGRPFVITKDSKTTLSDNWWSNGGIDTYFDSSFGTSLISFNNGDIEFKNRVPSGTSMSTSVIMSANGYIQHNYQIRSNSVNSSSTPSYTWTSDVNSGIYYIPSHNYTPIGGGSSTNKGVGISVGSNLVAALEQNLNTFYQGVMILGSSNFNSLGFSNGTNTISITPTASIASNISLTIPNKNGYIAVFEDMLNVSSDDWVTFVRTGGDWYIAGVASGFNVIEIITLNGVSVNSVAIADGSYVKVKKIGNIITYMQSINVNATATRNIDFISLSFGVPTIGLTSSGFASTIDRDSSSNVYQVKSTFIPASSSHIVFGGSGTFTVDTFILNNYIGVAGTGYVVNSGTYKVTGTTLAAVRTGTINY